MTPAEEATEGSRRGLGSALVGLVLLGAIGLGIWLRMEGLEAMLLYGDEYHGVRVARADFATIFTTYDGHGTHAALPLVQRLFAYVIGPGMLAFRLPATLAGVLTLIAFYPIARGIVGRAPALVGTVALSLSPLHVYYSRFGRAYAMTILLGLVLLWLVHRLDALRWRGTALLVAATLTAALLPWVHLSSVGLVIALGCAAMWRMWSAEGSARGALRPLVVFVASAVICVVLFLPVIDQVIRYATRFPAERMDRPDGPLGISILLAGGVVEGIAWIIGVPFAAVALFLKKPSAATFVIASILGPLVFLVTTLPHGMEYAYARYLVNALPGMVMLMSWLVVGSITRAAGDRVAVAVGIALVAASFFAGPLSPRRAPQGPFANTYLAMRSLPAFDRPFRGIPLYELIANDAEATRIIEAPSLHTRAVLMYRNYFLIHGKEVRVGLITDPNDVRLDGPYAFIGDAELGRTSGAQYLVVHKEVLVELAGYWTFVYDAALARVKNRWNRGFMDRHRTYFVPEDDIHGMVKAMLVPLREQLGQPFYEDRLVVAWRLRR